MNVEQQIAALVAERRGTVRRIISLESIAAAALLGRKRPQAIEKLKPKFWRCAVAFAPSISKSGKNQMPPPNAQRQTEPASFAPSRREIVCIHEAGHVIVGVYLYGSIAGARVNDGGGGVVWRDETPDDNSEGRQEAARRIFADTEDLLASVGPMPIALVHQHLGMWRSTAIFYLAGPEAERLAFGLTLSPPNGDLLVAKSHCRRGAVSRAGANLLLDHCRAEARAILQMRWPAVEAVARELDREDELTGEQVARLIEKNPPLR
jgi:hypothetical protein